MNDLLTIRTLKISDINHVTQWSRDEGFAPGNGDVGIYKHTDQQGLWIGCINNKPIGCIAGVKYNSSYGFIGLFLVVKKFRGKGYGLELWKHALKHLSDLPCIGLEAAPDRVKDYTNWGFKLSSSTTRWKWEGSDHLLGIDNNISLKDIKILEGEMIPRSVVQTYDAKREASPRPHFLSDWLNHPAGNVLALIDSQGLCHGFGRIRPCLLKSGEGWRIGPLLADTPQLAEVLIRKLVIRHPGVVLIDVPELNSFAPLLLNNLGFERMSETFRMYRGTQPPISMSELYGLACLELG